MQKIYCPSCHRLNPEGAPYCLYCGDSLSFSKQQSKGDGYSIGDTSGVYHHPQFRKFSDTSPTMESLSTTKELPLWEDMYSDLPETQEFKKKPARKEETFQNFERMPSKPPLHTEAADYYPNTFLNKFMSNLPYAANDVGDISITTELPDWDKAELNTSMTTKPSEPPPPLPPQQPAPAAAGRPPPERDQISEQTGKGPGGNKIAMIITGILTVTVLFIVASTVLVYLFNKQAWETVTKQAWETVTASHAVENNIAGEPQAEKKKTAAPRKSKPHQVKTKGIKKEKEIKEEKETQPEPVKEPEKEEEPDRKEEPKIETGEKIKADSKPTVTVFKTIKNLNPLLNDPPSNKLFRGRILEQGHIVLYSKMTFAIDTPAKVYTSSFLKGKIPKNRSLVDVTINVKGHASVKKFKVYIFDANGNKRGPNTSAENYLDIPAPHKLWKKSSWIPKDETHYLHRGFLVAENSASSFIIEIRSKKSKKVLWIKIGEEVVSR